MQFGFQICQLFLFELAGRTLILDTGFSNFDFFPWFYASVIWNNCCIG